MLLTSIVCKKGSSQKTYMNTPGFPSTQFMTARNVKIAPVHSYMDAPGLPSAQFMTVQKVKIAPVYWTLVWRCHCPGWDSLVGASIGKVHS